MSRPAEPYPIAPSRVSAAPMTMSSPLEELPARMIVRTPVKPITRPSARRAVTRSWRASLPITATKNGAVLSRTAAIAGPARLVPSASAASESVVPPKPIAAANPHRRSVRGRREPKALRNGSRTRKPNAPRENAVNAGVV